MRREFARAGAACAIIIGFAAAASGGIVDIAVGVYGGACFPMESDGSAGTVFGAKLRVLPPVPMIGVDAYYQRIVQKDAADVWNEGDVGVAFDGDGLDVFGADVLIGGVRGVPGFKWYGIAGVNFVEFSEGGSSEYRMGGQAGVGLEVVPPLIGLSVEGRATVVVLGFGDDPDPRMTTLSVGVNYYF